MTSTTTTTTTTVCDWIVLDVLAEALQFVDSRDLVRLASVDPRVLPTLRAIGWVFHPMRCLTPAALAELGELGVTVWLEYHKADNKGDCSESWVAPDMQYHREDDLPAMCSIWEELWFHHGKLHREHDRPAIVRRTGRWWYVRGQQHRDGGLPAVEWTNGAREWWVHGKRFRANGGHVIEHSNGDREWRDDDERDSMYASRRYDLPCIERANGDMEWRHRGVLHRANGPAVLRNNGTKEWWIAGLLQSRP